jgi:hypothetical protein
MNSSQGVVRASATLQLRCWLAGCAAHVTQLRVSAPPLPPTPPSPRCALDGLLAGGLSPSQLIAVSRNPNGAAAQALQAQGVEVRGVGGVQGVV